MHRLTNMAYMWAGGGGEIKPFPEIAEHSETIKSKKEAIRYGRVL